MQISPLSVQTFTSNTFTVDIICYNVILNLCYNVLFALSLSGAIILLCAAAVIPVPIGWKILDTAMPMKCSGLDAGKTISYLLV